ncbi:MAG: asparaginase [Vulcanimicrobiota bacterium]
MKTSVYILYTGGTIGMKPGSTGALVPASRDELLACLTGLGEESGVAWELGSLTEEDGSEVGPLDSSAVSPAHWVTIAAALERVYAKYDGFVVLHGTDTLAYTASALSFLLVNLAKPVILTGAQRPIFCERTDAHQNLINALHIAGYKATGLPLVAEVAVCFGDALLRGNRTRKYSTAAWQGFASPNYPRLGDLGETIVIHKSRLRPVPDAEAPFYIHRRLEGEVMDVTLFPGVKASQFQAMTSLPGLRGLLLRTFGSGTTPRNPELLEAIGEAARRGLALLVITQCYEGSVDLGRYDASSALLEERLSSGFDLTPEAALTKLMWLLALESGREAGVQLAISHRGEQSFNQFDLVFPPPTEATNLHEVSQRAAGPVSRARLKRAIVRVSGLESQAPVRVFLNAAGLSPQTPSQDVRCLAELNPDGGHAVADVSEGVKRLMVAERPFRLTVTAAGQPFSYQRLTLSLLLEAPD